VVARASPQASERKSQLHDSLEKGEKMKQKLLIFFLGFYLIVSFAFAQTDKATGTVTNDQTMSRLRMNVCVSQAPNVDVYVNGEIAVNGGQEQVNIPAGYFPGYLFLTPGSHSVALVPTGKGITEALLGPLELSLVAGHRYSLIVMGQQGDNSLKPLVIDETTELQKVRTSRVRTSA
jgi:Domain of unknown function (DUF4397)